MDQYLRLLPIEPGPQRHDPDVCWIIVVGDPAGWAVCHEHVDSWQFGNH
ncbi:hypothetical protein [Mycolicibacterium fortuitum]|uniref:Uncharacterized protein n=1 Tax=Mycolicibacterium fortuitum TaxID=1766 RepID=A0AAE4VIX3_MYCFO|nr:hypothetical protein [Mycolicibacterium fortuitum]MDV7195653.1 hypothetical protein [Mycolicibacterium fortuitum]MDV7209328.1 hypothetical protein [Mycolicibacterium fortuitum]MDV7231166.1 hypothetical protein [Mycolicibacterium fortuitum]MDV7262749.1 hypothetical protein [Mycolicibacterium fortuitum]MDV7288259.1 hypothetical protein [Mycolicibacterium fortuitum]